MNKVFIQKIILMKIKSILMIIGLICFLFRTDNVIAEKPFLPNFGFICESKKSNEKFEFIFQRNANDTEDIVFRRIKGDFEKIGIVLAQKSGAYVLWEDKVFFRTTDFAWMLDKVTSKLTPLILSIGAGLEDLKKIPQPMTCNSRSIYY
tara:strand:- start:98 stop:544 length:447 start_codon:yes stop_codon:yes gene_type:complete